MKKNVIIGIIIVLLIIGIILIINLNKNEEKDCMNQPTIYKQKSCLVELALKSGDVTVCENLDTPYNKRSCYSSIGMRTKDESICEYVDETLRQGCYYLVEGAKQEELDLEKIELAKEKQDPSICENIHWSQHKKQCYIELAKILLDSSLCKKAEPVSHLCALEIAIETGNVSHCDNSGSEMFHPNLERDNCYTEFAIFNNDKSICEELTENIRIIDCYTQVEEANK